MAIRATDEIPSIKAARWVLIGYETLAGRDERIETTDEHLKNELSAFFTKTFESDPSDRLKVWKVSALNEGDATQPKTQKQGRAFTILAHPKAAGLLQNELACERGSWLDAKLRQRLEKVTTRLGKPVLVGLQTWNPWARRLGDPPRFTGCGRQAFRPWSGGFSGTEPPRARAAGLLSRRSSRVRRCSSTSPFRLGSSVDKKARELSVFAPEPAHDRFLAHAESFVDAPDFNPILGGGKHLGLERFIVTHPSGLQDEGALTVQTLGPLRSADRTTVFTDALTAATSANVDDGRSEHPRT